MDAIAGYGSDSSSSSSEAPPPRPVPKPEADPPPKKKSRWDTPKPKEDFAPRLSSQSIGEWDVDYLSKHPPHDSEVTMSASARSFLEERLNQTTLDSTTKALGKQLKESHDFHNPRYLENAAFACGISELLGTNLPAPETFENYEFNLLEFEEAARVKMYEEIQQQHEQNQQYQASQYATDQLERALQQHCRR
jgi:hypothetical protein